MIVCLCQVVTDRAIREAAARGARTLAAVSAACGAGTDCGGCRGSVRRLLAEVDGATATASAACGEGAGCAACPASAPTLQAPVDSPVCGAQETPPLLARGEAA